MNKLITNKQTHTNIHTHTYARISTHKYTHIHICTHAHTQIHTHMHACAHTNTHTCARMCVNNQIVLMVVLNYSWFYFIITKHFYSLYMCGRVIKHSFIKIYVCIIICVYIYPLKWMGHHIHPMINIYRYSELTSLKESYISEE